MSKQKTALQQAIESIAKESKYMHSAYQHACNNAIGILTKLLPAERKQIEDAYLNGGVNGLSPLGRPSELASNYFTETFETK